ncbi:ABC transporter ATP-binding protein [Saccharothrix coeruleofusca]|uniref:ABC transporter ATP-binding protein n=1 Tax=Saccharothrix coeruleofusca TaxID=33919 RepID=A0A918AGS0_9PSEU|nr:ABC transporter ATP-binding protein [Saccharothrix coeruleofusca]MBP2340544.1 ATP-binding cassette subfamily B protein [Saccharothrix coeruleofusca]GGP34725.1 ABC transporter ATP-binding protein [Saccharothrix coeruleofusca]
MKDQRTSTAATLRRLWPYLKPVRTPILLSTASALLAMLCGLGIPLITQRIVDGPVARRELDALPWLIGLVLALGCAEAALFYARRKLIAGPAADVEARMRADLYHHLQRLPVAFHDRWQSGQLLSRATTDLSAVRRFVAFVVIFLVVNSLVLVVGLGVLFWLSPLLGAVVLACTLPMVALSYLFETRFKVVARRAQDQAGDLTTVVEESVLGIRVLKAFGRGPLLAQRFLRQARELRATELAKVRIFAALWAVLIILPELGIAGQLALGSMGIAQGTTTVGTLVAAITVSAYLRWPTDSIGWLLAETNQTASAVERYFEVLDEPVAITSPDRPRPLPVPVRGHVRFEGVRFRHPGSDREVLRGVDLDIRPGETVALVGATGSGKTTVTALVPRLADVTAGRVTVDGVDVRDLDLAELRRVVGTAFEEPVLFSAAVTENVALGQPDLDQARVREALRVARAEEFVDALPWGLDTRIGEQGLSLSGGQRQRLALARAVVGRPAVLVLDDPLSALDVHTEAEVEAALRRVLSGVTALVVAHRPSTVQLADRVAMLVDGRVAAVGEHRRLLAENEQYRHLLSTLEDEEVAA